LAIISTSALVAGNATVFAAEEAGKISIAIPYKGKAIAEYRFTLLPLEQTGDEYDAQLPDSVNWLICDAEYIVFHYEITELAEGYLPPLSNTAMQLFFANGETVDAIPHENVSFRLTEELPENEGLIFLPVPQTVAPPETARFSYSIREEVPKIYGGSNSVRILEMGAVVEDINEEDWKW
jgi:hypothetical protein